MHQIFCVFGSTLIHAIIITNFLVTDAYDCTGPMSIRNFYNETYFLQHKHTVCIEFSRPSFYICIFASSFTDKFSKKIAVKK